MSQDKTPQYGRKPLPVLRLNASETGDCATARVQMKIGDEPVRMEITVPKGQTSTENLLPIFQGFTNAVVDISVQKRESEGLQVSCQKGCGACCRQCVPVSTSEMRALARLVENLPEPRQSQVRKRFVEAVEKLDEAGLLAPFRSKDEIKEDQIKSIGMNYFNQQVACPFLEDESCSIHTNRPLACREYLVTSPAENCQRPTPETIDRVPLLAQQARALRTLDRKRTPDTKAWMPLVLSLEWSDAHPFSPTPEPGPNLVTEFFSQLTGRPDLADTIHPS